MRISILSISFLCFLLVHNAALSQESSSEPITPSIDTITIEDITIVTSRANRTDPVSIQNIKKADIEKIYAGQNPSVLISQLSPSVISYSDAGTDIGNYAQFRMRGISQNRINISLNGVPLNDMLDQGTFFSNFTDFGNSVESIQIQRGVGASNVGVSSYGGAVNFQSTNIFDNAPSAEIQLTGGSFGTRRASGEIATGQLKNNTAFYSRFSRTTTDGYKTHSASDAYSFFFSGGHSSGKNLFKFTAFAGKSERDQSYLPVLLSDITADPKTNYNHPNDMDDFEQEMVQLQYSRQHADHLSSNVIAYYSGARGVFPFAIDDETQFVYGLSNDRYGIIANLNYNRNSWNIKSGIHAYTMDRINTEHVAPNTQNPYLKELTNKKEVSAFTKLSYDINNWKLYGDLSLRSVTVNFDPDPIVGTGVNHERDWVFLNWIGGVTYNLNNASSIYASYGRAGREPTRSDMLRGSEQEIKSNIIKEEYVNDLELGYRYAGNKLSLNANIFHMSFDNEISKIGALQERSYMEVTQNVDHSTRTGLEIQGRYNASNSTTLGLNLAYMITNVEEYINGDQTFNDVEQIFAPKWLMTPTIRHQFSEKLSAQLSGRYASQSFMELSNNPDFVFPSYFILDSQVDYSISKNTSFSLFVNNITDKLYFTDGAPVDIDFDGNVEGPGYRVQPVRSIYIQFKCIF